MSDMVNHPKHYNSHPSGVECIDIIEHMNFCLGNAIKYIWRAGLKNEELEDLKKARFYLDREISRIEATKSSREVQCTSWREPPGPQQVLPLDGGGSDSTGIDRERRLVGRRVI